MKLTEQDKEAEWQMRWDHLLYALTQAVDYLDEQHACGSGDDVLDAVRQVHIHSAALLEHHTKRGGDVTWSWAGEDT